MQNRNFFLKNENGQFFFFLPHTVISNSEKLTHPNVQHVKPCTKHIVVWQTLCNTICSMSNPVQHTLQHVKPCTKHFLAWQTLCNTICSMSNQVQHTLQHVKPCTKHFVTCQTMYKTLCSMSNPVQHN